MLHGKMMNLPLSITSIMDFAEKAHHDTQIISVSPDNPRHSYTYGDAFKRIRKLANALDSVGIKSGDRVATLAWNDYRHFELYYAIPCLGAVCHTINPRLFPEQVRYIVNHAENEIIFSDPGFIPLLEEIKDDIPHVKKIIVLTNKSDMPDSSMIDLIDYESFIENQSDRYSWPDLDENTACGLCYTSGTTGDPKGVLYSHRSTVLHAQAAISPDVMCLSSRDSILPIVPMFHVNAWSIPYAGVIAGSKLVFPGAKMGDGQALQNLIESEEVTISAGVPTVWLALQQYLRDSGKGLSKLERVVSGGAACPWPIIEEFETKYNVKMLQGWGMTETSPLGVFNTFKPNMDELSTDEIREYKLRQGRPIFGVDIRIIDEDRNPLPWDGTSTGEVQVRGNWVCDGYYKKNNEESVDDDGYFSTGDVASFDKYGFMRITDRIKDVIKSGGEWISSIELENAAIGHPDVMEAAVIGVPDHKWTERPLLIIKKKPGTDPSDADILQSLEGKVAKWWIPERVEFVDSIPHTATGKISKKDLRMMFLTT